MIPVGDCIIILLIEFTNIAEQNFKIFIFPKCASKFLELATTNLLVDIRFMDKVDHFLEIFVTYHSSVKVLKRLKNICISNFLGLTYPISCTIAKLGNFINRLELDGSNIIEGGLPALMSSTNALCQPGFYYSFQKMCNMYVRNFRE